MLQRLSVVLALLIVLTSCRSAGNGSTDLASSDTATSESTQAISTLVATTDRSAAAATSIANQASAGSSTRVAPGGVTTLSGVRAEHPRLLLSPDVKTRLLARKDAGDSTWLALKTQADTLTTYAIFPYNYARRSEEPNNTIFYDYQGEGWYAATLPLALAYQMTGDKVYSAKEPSRNNFYN
jgi:hypothetical protein